MFASRSFYHSQSMITQLASWSICEAAELILLVWSAYVWVWEQVKLLPYIPQAESLPQYLQVALRAKFCLYWQPVHSSCSTTSFLGGISEYSHLGAHQQLCTRDIYGSKRHCIACNFQMLPLLCTTCGGSHQLQT